MPRLTREQYARYSALARDTLLTYFDDVRLGRTLEDKETHGDIDVIVSAPSRPFDLPSPRVVRNGNVTSLDFHGFQLDVIQYPAITEMVMLTHDYGDLAAIMGMILSRHGLKLSSHGLYLVHSSGKLLLSREVEGILRFLGLAPEPFERGFATQSDALGWLATCRLPVSDISTRTSKYRSNVPTRPMQRAFADYVRRCDDDGSLDSARVRSEALSTFGKDGEYERLLHRERVRAETKAKFNGELVTAWTGLRGAALGRLMAGVRAAAPVCDMTPEAIKQLTLSSMAPASGT